MSTEQLFVGGTFTVAGTQLVNNVATFNGAIWIYLIENFEEVGTNGDVLALAVFDDGSSEAIYVGGDFTMAGAKAVGGIASWRDPFTPGFETGDTSAWSATTP